MTENTLYTREFFKTDPDLFSVDYFHLRFADPSVIQAVTKMGSIEHSTIKKLRDAELISFETFSNN